MAVTCKTLYDALWDAKELVSIPLAGIGKWIWRKDQDSSRGDPNHGVTSPPVVTFREPLVVSSISTRVNFYSSPKCFNILISSWLICRFSLLRTVWRVISCLRDTRRVSVYFFIFLHASCLRDMRPANCLWSIQRTVPAVGTSDSNVCDAVCFFRFGKKCGLDSDFFVCFCDDDLEQRTGVVLAVLRCRDFCFL